MCPTVIQNKFFSKKKWSSSVLIDLLRKRGAPRVLKHEQKEGSPTCSSCQLILTYHCERPMKILTLVEHRFKRDLWEELVDPS